MAIKVHQALFGYDGGHEMLATSIRLSTESRQSLAVATDLSGSPPPEGFDRTYTGFPLPDTDFYALFCTWLAPEMPRPGCVWSQVLFIELSDLAELQDLGFLKTLFTRPSFPPSLSAYSRTLCVENRPPDSFSMSPTFEPVVVEALGALYNDATLPVVVVASKASVYEEVLFSLWSQQWPKLRRNFWFSTGSFGDRGRHGTFFDMQVTPEANLRAWRRDGNSKIIGSAPGKLPSGVVAAEAWVRAATEDIAKPDAAGFRSFLSIHGADISSLRPAFPRLGRVWVDLGDAPTLLEESLRSAAREFPDAGEAKTLKQSILSIGGTEAPSTNELDRIVQAVAFLCIGDTHGAFRSVEFDFAAAVEKLWPARREALAATLAQPPLSEGRWSALAEAVVREIKPDEMLWLFESHPELLMPFVRLRPRLATCPSLWMIAERGQWMVVEALEAVKVDGLLWRDVVKAMLCAGTSVAAREVVQAAGDLALDGALAWLEESFSESLPPPLWREGLRPVAEARLADDTDSAIELAFCASLAAKRTAAQLSPSRRDVQTLAGTELESLAPALRLPTAFLLVTLGLQASGSLGAPLLARGFWTAHAALGGEAEPPEAWRLLQPHLPLLWFWEEWDRCKKLRRALKKWLSDYPKAFDILFTAAKTPSDRKWLESLD